MREKINVVVVGEMPWYRCHKKVQALKIQDIGTAADGARGVLTPENDRYPPLIVSVEYMAKHNPQIGGYYVVYEDGYKSFSPAEAFESGYTLISDRKSYQARVVEEKRELDEKLARLIAFIAVERFSALSMREQVRLYHQRDIMKDYSVVLGERIEAF